MSPPFKVEKIPKIKSEIQKRSRGRVGEDIKGYIERASKKIDKYKSILKTAKK